jgi:hypothetical protein
MLATSALAWQRMVATDCMTPPRIPTDQEVVSRSFGSEYRTANRIAFDVVDLDSEVAVDASEQPGPAGTSYEVLSLLLAADSNGTCCPLASATEPAFSPASTFVAEAATWSASVRSSRWSSLPLDQPIARRARSRGPILLILLVSGSWWRASAVRTTRCSDEASVSCPMAQGNSPRT